MDIRRAIDIISRFGHLQEDEAEAVMNQIMRGESEGSQIGAYLMGLRMKGETESEIVGSARAMRQNAVKIPIRTRGDLLDTCGTGGDGSGTFNISTATAFVAAGAGVRIAKHGNHAVTGKCGSADVLAELGMPLDLSPEQVGRCVDEIGIGFFFAPKLHPAMRHAVGPRRAIGVRTIFNILGPLTNPAGANRQLTGVFAPDLTDFLAGIFGLLGSTSAIVVCGYGNMDELTTTGPNRVSHYVDGEVNTYDLNPLDFQLERAHISDLVGGEPELNARILRGVLSGEEDGPKGDVVLLNSAGALVAAGVTPDISEGLEMAREVIGSGAALEKLDTLIEMTRDLASARGE